MTERLPDMTAYDLLGPDASSGRLLLKVPFSLSSSVTLVIEGKVVNPGDSALVVRSCHYSSLVASLPDFSFFALFVVSTHVFSSSREWMGEKESCYSGDLHLFSRKVLHNL